MKVHRVVLMVLDHDEVGAEGISEIFEIANFPNDCIRPEVMECESRDIGEWDDDDPLNYKTTSKQEFERLFSQSEEKQSDNV